MQKPPTYKEQIIAALDALSASPSTQTEVLSFLGAQLQAEQSHYWSRFAAFAAVHAGLLVIAFEIKLSLPLLIPAVGLLLGVFWCVVQLKSLKYAERWKPFFHGYRIKMELLWERESHENVPSSWSSTRVAMAVPFVIAFVWLMLMVSRMCPGLTTA